MGAGQFNKRITLQCPTKISDGMGGFATPYIDHAIVWAAVWPISAKKKIEAMQPGLNVTHHIRIRYRSVLKSDWRVKFGNRYFSIDSIINPNSKNEILDLLCEEAG
jgi:SPP1 family predicted phage head-tail adaptor